MGNTFKTAFFLTLLTLLLMFIGLSARLEVAPFQNRIERPQIESRVPTESHIDLFSVS